MAKHANNHVQKDILHSKTIIITVQDNQIVSLYNKKDLQ